MYGKLMSISDELMWKYWVLLTDLRQSEIEAMRAEVAAGKLHPMEVKKQLARTIVAGFHGEAEAQSADENWARMFQQKEGVDALAEEICIDWEKLVVADAVTLGQLRLNSKRSFHINVGKLLVALGICDSRTQGERQASVGVMIDGAKRTNSTLEIPGRPSRFTVRVGKRAKIAVIS
jgi:tyrosyl-tRNA synthetase